MPSTTLTVSDQDRSTLTSWARSSTVSAGHAERAAIVLACADGSGTSEAARKLGVTRPTVTKWRDRFLAHGIAGLDDEPRSAFRPGVSCNCNHERTHTALAGRVPRTSSSAMSVGITQVVDEREPRSKGGGRAGCQPADGPQVGFLLSGRGLDRLEAVRAGRIEHRALPRPKRAKRSYEEPKTAEVR